MLPTVSSCSVVLDLLCREGRVKESCKLLKAALKKGIVADEVVCAKVIYCLCREGCLDEALEL